MCILMTGAEISLNSLLEAREVRAVRQNTCLQRWRQPIISLTLVSPGPVKDCPGCRYVMSEAIEACERVFRKRNWTVLSREIHWLPSGPEALWCVEHTAREVKALLIELEESHALGRLWDIDVICPIEGLLSREHFCVEARKCLVCQQYPSRICSRSRRHPLNEVLKCVEVIIDGSCCRT